MNSTLTQRTTTWLLSIKILYNRLAEGGELFDEIARRKYFSEENAAEVISQLLSAIIYCHERRIVHRDLKPENILLEHKSSDKLQIKVIDFGTAKAFDPVKKLRATTGTAYYIAPEVLLKNYDERCDVWSCGVILYILLCGAPPFNGRDDAAIFEAVKRTTFTYRSTFILIIGKIWNNVSNSAKDLINKMISYPPEQRISSQEAYAHEWLKSKNFNKFQPDIANTIMSNLKNFHVRNP